MLRRTSEGTASDSAKTSASSPRHTKLLNSGRSCSLNFPMSTHLAATAMNVATIPDSTVIGSATRSPVSTPCSCESVSRSTPM